jgi:hypothetical protein
MNRAENCVDCKIMHITFEGDCLVFEFACHCGFNSDHLFICISTRTGGATTPLLFSQPAHIWEWIVLPLSRVSKQILQRYAGTKPFFQLSFSGHLSGTFP